MITLELPLALKAPLSRGHPWVYRSQIPSHPDLPSGTWVQVRCGGYSAYGLWDDQSPIAVRLFTSPVPPVPAPQVQAARHRGRWSVPDARWVADRIAEAWETREPIRAGATTAYRWVYGESDGLPGIVVDLYGDYAVIRSYVESVQAVVPWVAEALHAHAPLQGILWRRPADSQGSEAEPFWGRPPPRDMVVEEHGLLFFADLFAGQKTGLYFDQRENRRTLAPWCQERRVLDCFCYTGAFSLYAARAGAASITACDAAAGAVEAAQRNFTLNGFSLAPHTFLVQDCFDLLAQLAAEARRFDVVILDPPSFAHDRQSRSAAERAYLRLNRLALDCVETGGLLASASCTSQVSPQAFREVLAEAARRANKRLLILHEAGHAVDHPVAAHFPEGRYLKFVIGRVLPLY